MNIENARNIKKSPNRIDKASRAYQPFTKEHEECKEKTKQFKLTRQVQLETKNYNLS